MIEEAPNKKNSKIADLMIPRFICVEDFPGNPFQIFGKPLGQHDKIKILSPTKKYPLEYFQDKFGHTYSQFRELHWNEFRQESELPAYIKLKRYPETRELPVVFKVIKSLKDWPPIGEETACIEGGSKFEGYISYTDKNKEYRLIRDITDYWPATEKEFLEQKYKTVPQELIV
jgi:hypothetical protein